MMLNRFAEVAVSHGSPKVIGLWDKVVMEEMTGVGLSTKDIQDYR